MQDGQRSKPGLLLPERLTLGEEAEWGIGEELVKEREEELLLRTC